MLFLSLLTCLRPSGRLAVSVSTFGGESHIIALICHVLTFLLVFLTIFASILMLCISVRTADPSAWFPQSSALPMRQVFVPTGRLGSFCCFEVY